MINSERTDLSVATLIGELGHWRPIKSTVDTDGMINRRITFTWLLTNLKTCNLEPAALLDDSAKRIERPQTQFYNDLDQIGRESASDPFRDDLDPYPGLGPTESYSNPIREMCSQKTPIQPCDLRSSQNTTADVGYRSLH